MTAAMSAIGHLADIQFDAINVRFRGKADTVLAPRKVR
jgi:hypothetical protein